MSATRPCGWLQSARGAQRVSPAHGGRAVSGSGPRPDVVRRRSGAVDRKRAVAQGRWLGVLFRRASAHPRAYRLPVRRGSDRRDRRSSAGGTAAHTGGAAADSVYAQGGDLPGHRMGSGRRAQPAFDLWPTLASREHARFKQTDADVGSFDGSYGSAYLARQVGQKFAREIFFLGRAYTAEQMHRMGAVNEVVDHADLESVGVQWAADINAKSPQAQRMLKYSLNLLADGLVGQQLFAGEATRLAYMTDEAV